MKKKIKNARAIISELWRPRLYTYFTNDRNMGFFFIEKFLNSKNFN